jgi:hypothetical protein
MIPSVGDASPKPSLLLKDELVMMIHLLLLVTLHYSQVDDFGAILIGNCTHSRANGIDTQHNNCKEPQNQKASPYKLPTISYDVVRPE